MFPHFIRAFIKKDEEVPIQTCESIPPIREHWSDDYVTTSVENSGKQRVVGHDMSLGVGRQVSGTSSLRQLDLGNLARDCGPPTELRNRKTKFAKYERDCSRVGDGLFVGGEVVAKSRDILLGCNITHVINCVGMLYPAYFEDELEYQTLYLQDSPKEDILAVLYDVFDFIERAREKGNVFVHCSQGVSRSMTLAIAYRMWKEQRQYEDIFAEVKEMRGVANPNVGFICQLMQWHKRRTELSSRANLYRIAPQSTSDPTYLVPKWVNGCDTRGVTLDPRGSFILHSGSRVYLWKGSTILSEEYIDTAHNFIDQLKKYEVQKDVCVELIITNEGQEDDTFWELLKQCIPSLETRGSSQCPAFDTDYDNWIHARFPQKHSQDRASSEACGSARSGRKTPRVEIHSFSPNDRLRKQARSESFEEDSENQRGGGYLNRSKGASQRSESPHVLGHTRENSSRPVSPVDEDYSSSEEHQSDSSDDDDDDESSKERNSESALKRNIGIPKLNLG